MVKSAKKGNVRKSAKKTVSGKKIVKKAVKTPKKPAKRMKIKKESRQVQTPAALPKMTKAANLLVTYDPSHRGTALQELKDAFKASGESYQIGDSGIEGLFKLNVSDARKSVSKLAGLCKKSPGSFAATHHYVPIDKWCRSELAEMQRTIKSLVGLIGTNEKWRMSLNRRQWDKIRGGELILKLTDVVDRRNVDLTSPQKIVQVEILGNEAGISVLKPQEILDVQRAKAER